MKVAVAYTTISVSDMGKAISYYRDIIGMDVMSERALEGESIDRLWGLNGVKARLAVMRLPAGSDIHLVQHFAHKGRPIPSTLRQYDIGLIHLDIASHGIDKIYEDFQRKGVRTNCPIQLNEPQNNRSVSFKAPDDVQLETHDWWVKHSWIPDVGRDKPFYALVHTALSIGDLEKTLHLYRDLLGLKVIRQSDLEGDRFDKMDGLEGGMARNTVVRADEGSEIQFLWHNAGAHKGQGRPIASTLQQCDLGIVNIGLKTDDIEGLYAALRGEGVAINCEIQVDPEGFRAFSFPDPDGNLLIAHE